MTTPYIPPKEADFANWSANFAATIAASPATYGLAAGDATAITAVDATFQAAYLVTLNPATRTTPAINAKDIAKATAQITERSYAQIIQANAGVSDAAKAAAGLTIRKPVPTPIPTPTTTPGMAVTCGQHLTTELRYFDTTTPTTKAKPFGAVGIQIWQTIGTAPATDPNAADFVGQFTKSPFTLTANVADVGKTRTIWARWVTRTNLVGPWSEALSMTIT